jgi:hypothetical protein
MAVCYSSDKHSMHYATQIYSYLCTVHLKIQIASIQTFKSDN